MSKLSISLIFVMALLFAAAPLFGQLAVGVGITPAATSGAVSGDYLRLGARAELSYVGDETMLSLFSGGVLSPAISTDLSYPMAFGTSGVLFRIVDRIYLGARVGASFDAGDEEEWRAFGVGVVRFQQRLRGLSLFSEVEVSPVGTHNAITMGATLGF